MSAVLPPQGGFVLRAPPPTLRSKPVVDALAWARPQASGARGSQATDGGRGWRRSAGLATVVVVHAAVGWLFASGLAREAVELVKKPIDMVIVPPPEVAPPPPPPPPPPKVEKIRELPKIKQPPPPPTYVPPPDVPVAAPPEPVIQAVQQAEPPAEPPVIAPPPPPAPAPAPPAVARQDVSVACPGYQTVLAQTLEEAFDRVGIAATVRTLIKLRGSSILGVQQLSGPKEYNKYLQSAIKRMRCSAGGEQEVHVSLDVVFRR